MWSKKRFDIGWGDLLAAVGYALRPLDDARAARAAAAAWGDSEHSLVCLTERGAFDLLLQALALPQGTEVLVSAVTIEDMLTIMRRHGLVPVPVDLSTGDMSVSVEALERARSPRTRAVLFAHLFGVRADLKEIAAWARQRDLLVLEDCAQAFEWDAFRGHPDADVSMFSFGPIKTATALFGGIVRVRGAGTLERMRSLHAQYPPQPRTAFVKRALTYSVLKAISGRTAFGLFTRLCALAGYDYEGMLNRAVRNLPVDVVPALRYRPSVPLLRLLARRLGRPEPERIARRRSNGRRLLAALEGRLECPGADAAHHSYWLFPVCVPDRPSALSALREAGFDAAAGGQLIAVPAPPERPTLEAAAARRLCERMIFVPAYPEMSDREIDRLAEVLLDTTESRALPAGTAARS